MGYNPFDIKPDKSEFTARPPILRLSHIIWMAVGVVAITVVSSYYGGDLVRDVVTMGLIFIVILAMYFAQSRTVDEKTETEFQSMVFSNAMRANNMMLLITYRDGSIYYLDSRYMRSFEQAKRHRKLEDVLVGISMDDKAVKDIVNAVGDLQAGDLETEIKLETNKLKVLVEVAPLDRPAEFVAVVFKRV